MDWNSVRVRHDPSLPNGEAALAVIAENGSVKICPVPNADDLGYYLDKNKSRVYELRLSNVLYARWKHHADEIGMKPIRVH